MGCFLLFGYCFGPAVVMVLAVDAGASVSEVFWSAVFSLVLSVIALHSFVAMLRWLVRSENNGSLSRRLLRIAAYAVAACGLFFPIYPLFYLGYLDYRQTGHFVPWWIIIVTLLLWWTTLSVVAKLHHMSTPPEVRHGNYIIPRDLGSYVSGTSRHIPKSVKEYVFARDGGKCVYCGSTRDLQYDHFVPFSRGGSSGPENIQLLCRTCNLGKGNRF
jgi:hypothetical protein